MEPLLDLPIDQFFGALDELGLDPERRSDLLREYRRRNSAFSPVYGLLDSVADEDAAAGMRRADIVPISRPEGMSVAEAIRSGDWRLAVPQGALDAVGNVAGALDVPAAAAAGLIPREDMVGEALNAAGTVMGLGGLLARPAGSLGTGGRVASRSGDETPAQQVARLLREGRADEVTDDLMAQADPQEMYQLYVSGETGMDLPMDEASRMARAREMGFDTDVYRGMRAYEGGPTYRITSRGRELISDEPLREIMEINAPGQTYLPARMAGFTSDDPGVASSFQSWLREHGAVYPLRANTSGMVDIDFAGRPAGSGQFESFADRPTYDAVMEAVGDTSNAGVIMRNTADEGSVFVPRNPNQLRSRFARFDPRLSHLANLNAANIDPLTGAAAMGASQQQQDPLASLRAYLAQNGLLSQ